jgi:hypothetical protein
VAWAERYTDRMVRRYPTLLAIAIEYAQNYDGEFEPMVAARETIARTGFLETAQARTVLNCLRADTDLESMSLKIEAESVMNEDRQDKQVERRRGQMRVVKDEGPPKPPPRKHTIELPVKIKVPYAMPKQSNGALHVISWATREGRLRRDDPWSLRNIRPEDRPAHLAERDWRLVVHYKCGKYTEGPLLVADVEAALASDERRHKCRMGCW